MCGQIPEESQLLFRAPATASLECCCFIDDKEFLTGSDDGSVELWSIMRKKPTHIIRNAHPVFRNNLNSLENNVEGKMLYEEQFTTSCKVFLYVEFTSVLFSPFFSFCYYVVLFVVEMSINLIINFHHHHSIFFVLCVYVFLIYCFAPQMQKMAYINLKVSHQPNHGLVLLLQEEVLILLHQEQQMVQFVFGLLNLILRAFGHYLV